MISAHRNAKKRRNAGAKPPPHSLFTNQFTHFGDVRPGGTIEIRFDPSPDSSILVLAVERCPSVGAVLDQDYCVELFDTGQQVPVARKQSLRGVVVTSLTHALEGEPDGQWIARLTNTGTHSQLLSLLVAVA